MAYSLQNVFKGSAIYVAAQLAVGAAGFLLLPLYTRFLTPTDYGIVGYLTVILELLGTVLMFGFVGAQTRYYIECRATPARFGEFAFSINAYLVVVLLASCFGLSLVGQHLHRALAVDDIPYHPYFPIVIWTVAFHVLNQLVVTYYLAAREYLKCALLQVAQFASITALVILFVVFLGEGAAGRMTGILFGNVLFFAAAYPFYAKRFRFRFDWSHVRYSLSFGLPLVFHLAAVIIHGTIDRIILERFVSVAEIGIYTVAYTIGSVLSVLLTATTRSWTPNFYELIEDGSRNTPLEVRRAFGVWFAVMATLCMGAVLWSNEAVVLVTPHEFHAAAKVVPILLVGFLTTGFYLFAMPTIGFYKKTIYLPFITGSSALLNIGLNFALIPRYGIGGAAIATLVSYFFQSAATIVVARMYFNPGYEWPRIAAVMASLGVAMIIARILAISVWAEFAKVALFAGHVGLCYLLFARHLRTLTKRARTRSASQ